TEAPKMPNKARTYSGIFPGPCSAAGGCP
ncbi:hypothetical protein CISIN_1g0432321mg, partial [Citrus sinensis]